jgi:hypothetical protein
MPGRHACWKLLPCAQFARSGPLSDTILSVGTSHTPDTCDSSYSESRWEDEVRIRGQNRSDPNASTTPEFNTAWGAIRAWDPENKTEDLLDSSDQVRTGLWACYENARRSRRVLVDDAGVRAAPERGAAAVGV